MHISKKTLFQIHLIPTVSFVGSSVSRCGNQSHFDAWDRAGSSFTGVFKVVARFFKTWSYIGIFPFMTTSFSPSLFCITFFLFPFLPL